MTRALVITCVLFAAACQSPTELLLVVQTDLDLTQLAYVEIATSGDASSSLVTDDDGGATQPCICVSPAACPGDAVPFPLTVPLEPGSQGTTPFQVAARAHGPGGCATHAFVEDSAALSFVPHERLGVYLALSTHCIEVTCAEGQTCNPTSGACVSNMTTGTKVDLDASPSSTMDASAGDAAVHLDTPPDLATTPSYFTLATVTGSFDWDVASNGSGFELVTLTDGVVSYGAVDGGFAPKGTIAAPADGSPRTWVCISSNQDGYLFATASPGVNTGTGDVTVYDPATGENAGTSVRANNPSQLQCKEDGAGVTFAWVDTLELSPMPPPTLVALRVIHDVDATGISASVASAGAFVLSAAPGGVASILLAPAMSHNGGGGPQPLLGNGMSDVDMGANGAACPDLELYQLFDESAGFVPTSPTGTSSPCIALDPGALFGVAALGDQTVVAGTSPDGSNTILSGNAASPMPHANASYGELAVAPVQSSVGTSDPSFILAIAYESSFGPSPFVAGLHVSRVQQSGVPENDIVLSHTLDVNQPVKIAVDPKSGAVLVTWIEPLPTTGKAGTDTLVGQILTP